MREARERNHSRAGSFAIMDQDNNENDRAKAWCVERDLQKRTATQK